MNNDLQITADELRRVNEEIRRVNEEIRRVNEEIRKTNDEIREANDEVRKIVEPTETGGQASVPEQNCLPRPCLRTGFRLAGRNSAFPLQTRHARRRA